MLSYFKRVERNTKIRAARKGQKKSMMDMMQMLRIMAIMKTKGMNQDDADEG
jgi:hypothetical protein